MTGVCLLVCVVGPVFDSTSPAFVRSRASQAPGRDGRLAQKTESGPHLWGQGLYRHNLCRCLKQSNQSLSSSQTTLRNAKSTQHIETTHPDVNLKLAFHKVASFHPHYLTFILRTYHHPEKRFRSWPTQMTSIHTSTSAAKKYIQPCLHKSY